MSFPTFAGLYFFFYFPLPLSESGIIISVGKQTLINVRLSFINLQINEREEEATKEL